MEKRIRLREVVNWLMYTNKMSSQKEFAESIDYSPTVLCSALTGKIPCSDKLIAAICEKDECINKQWIMTGDGEMLLGASPLSCDQSHDDKQLSAAYALITYLIKEGGQPLLDKVMHTEHAPTAITAMYSMVKQ